MNYSATLLRVVRSSAVFASVAGIAILAGCSSAPPYPPAPTSAATPDYLYKIGPLDSVNVNVWRNPELSMSVTVRPDGKITAPLIEDLPALGKDPTTLARDIEKALSKYIRDPVVTVIVGRVRRPVSGTDSRRRRSGEAAGDTLPARHDDTRPDDRCRWS